MERYNFGGTDIFCSNQDNSEANHLIFKKDKADKGTYQNATSLKTQVLKLINGNLIDYLKVMERFLTVKTTLFFF